MDKAEKTAKIGQFWHISLNSDFLPDLRYSALIYLFFLEDMLFLIIHFPLNFVVSLNFTRQNENLLDSKFQGKIWKVQK